MQLAGAGTRCVRRLESVRQVRTVDRPAGQRREWRPAARLFLDSTNEGNDVRHIIGAETFHWLHLSNAFGDALL